MYTPNPPSHTTLSQADLVAEFKANGLQLSSREAEQFWLLHNLLVERNEEGDLTRIDGWRSLILKHYVDGALAAEIIEPQGLTMDIGTGAGFPGLPLAIRRPHWPLLLAEPRGRRLAFMEEAVVRLGLTKVEFYPHKVGARFNRTIDNFITRDFESVADSFRRAALILPPGGRIYLMKGPTVDVEVQQARELPEADYFELEDDRAYSYDGGRIKRRLLTWRKKDKAPRPAPPPPWPIVEIASRENPRYKNWLKSLSGRGLRKSGQTLVSGAKFVREILDRYAPQVQGVIARRLDDLDGFSIPSHLTIHLARPEIYPELDTFGAGPPILILDIPELKVWPGALTEKITVFLPFQDPSNLGAAIRTSTALGAKVVLLKEAANPWHPKSLRASGPSILAVDMEQGPSLKELSGLNLPGLYALSPKGSDLFRATLPEPLGLVFGPEGPGLDELWPLKDRLSIAMSSEVESLNATAALAVTLGVIMVRRNGSPDVKFSDNCPTDSHQTNTHPDTPKT